VGHNENLVLSSLLHWWIASDMLFDWLCGVCFLSHSENRTAASLQMKWHKGALRVSRQVCVCCWNDVNEKGTRELKCLWTSLCLLLECCKLKGTRELKSLWTSYFLLLKWCKWKGTRVKSLWTSLCLLLKWCNHAQLYSKETRR
jgi:hypothetical protein